METEIAEELGPGKHFVLHRTAEEEPSGDTEVQTPRWESVVEETMGCIGSVNQSYPNHHDVALVCLSFLDLIYLYLRLS